MFHPHKLWQAAADAQELSTAPLPNSERSRADETSETLRAKSDSATFPITAHPSSHKRGEKHRSSTKPDPQHPRAQTGDRRMPSPQSREDRRQQRGRQVRRSCVDLRTERQPNHRGMAAAGPTGPASTGEAPGIRSGVHSNQSESRTGQSPHRTGPAEPPGQSFSEKPCVMPCVMITPHQ